MKSETGGQGEGEEEEGGGIQRQISAELAADGSQRLITDFGWC